MEYPKIHSLWKRHGWYLEEGKKHNPDYQAGRQSFIIGDYALPEFGTIKKWLVQEKIDGTNIRIHLSKDNFSQECVRFYGRSDEATIHQDLYSYLMREFTVEKLKSVFMKDTITPTVWLFGEGYGARIQKGGGNYRQDMGFILFDVKIDNWWLAQSSVKDIAEKLNIPYAPIIGIMSEEEIISYVKSKPLSLCSKISQIMEGIIARTEPLLLQRNGDPLIMKLKCKEFKEE